MNLQQPAELEDKELVEFKPVCPSQEQIAFIKATLSSFRCQAGKCFWNAQRVVVEDQSDRLEYAEGILRGPKGDEVHHAWVVLDGEIVIELSQRKFSGEDTHGSPLSNRHVGLFPSTWRYRGAIFNHKAVAQMLLNGNQYGCMMPELL